MQSARDLRRFLVMFVLRSLAFVHNQQLVVPTVLVVITIGWQALIGDWSWPSIIANGWRTMVPVIVTVGVFAVVMVVLAAKDLDREIAATHTKSYKPLVSSVGELIAPQISPRAPGLALGVISIITVVGFEVLVFRAAFPPIPYPARPFFLVPAVPENAKTFSDPTTTKQATGALSHTPTMPAPVKPTMPRTDPVRIGLVRYMPLPYEAGKKLRVRLFVDNKGIRPVTVYGRTISRLVENLPHDYEGRRKVEEKTWERRSLIPRSHIPINVPIIAPGTYYILLESGSLLTSDDITKLGSGSVMYLMSEIWDEHDQVILESCVFTEPRSEALNFCAGHNK